MPTTRMPLPVHILFGTRPEAIKIAPIVHSMRSDPSLQPILISTGQHREMLNPLLDTLRLKCHIELATMMDNQSLCDLNSTMVKRVGQLLDEERPELLLVHGDTATAFAGALAAFYKGVPVAHIEAGLRSGSLRTPFPEEFHRCAIARIAKWHFAPTDAAARNLLAEGIDPDDIEVTGSTAVDSLMWAMSIGAGKSAFENHARHNVLVTLHRRESQGGTMEGLARALAGLAEPRTDVVFLLHKNPAVRKNLLAAADTTSGARFLEPLDYPDFVQTMADADLILTDSGGVQDEATALGKRVLVLRERTDRPEAVEQGNAEVIGLNPETVLAHARRELAQDRPRAAELSTDGAFGDGHSASRIVQRLLRDLT